MNSERRLQINHLFTKNPGELTCDLIHPFDGLSASQTAPSIKTASLPTSQFPHSLFLTKIQHKTILPILKRQLLFRLRRGQQQNLYFCFNISTSVLTKCHASGTHVATGNAHDGKNQLITSGSKWCHQWNIRNAQVN